MSTLTIKTINSPNNIAGIEIADLRLERSQKVLRIEKALARTYIKISNEIQNDSNYPHNYSALFNRFNPLVYDNTRAALSVISQISTRYVNEKTKTNPYPTQQDIDLIKQQTDKAVDSFWRKIRLAMSNENAPLKTYVEMAATVAATGTLALTTRSKVNQLHLLSTMAPLGGGLTIYSSEEDWSPELDISEQSKRKPKFVWRASLDERTCDELPNGEPGCATLNGKWWYSDDPEVPTPGELGPLGTHPHCRCIIDLVMPGDPTYGSLE